jgi:hypothetical protein
MFGWGLTLFWVCDCTHTYAGLWVDTEFFLQCQHCGFVNKICCADRINSKCLLVSIANGHSASNIMKIGRQSLWHHNCFSISGCLQIRFSPHARLLLIKSCDSYSIVALSQFSISWRWPERSDVIGYVIFTLFGVHVQSLDLLQIGRLS